MTIARHLTSAYGTRLFIVSLDLLFATLSFFLAILLRFNFEMPHSVVNDLFMTLALVVFLRALSFKMFRTYSGIIRFTGEQDILRAFFAISISSLALFGLTFIEETALEGMFFLKRSVVIIDYFLCLFLLTVYRISVRSAHIHVNRERKLKKRENVVIFGGGRCALITKRSIDADAENNLNVVAFFDDDPYLHRKTLDGVKIHHLSTEGFQQVLQKYGAKKAIIAIQKISQKRKRELTDLCLERNIQPMIVPPAEQWWDGSRSSLRVSDIRNIKIEDLLHRDAIQLDEENISAELTGKVILVTGAAGSIGSEICRQITKYGPKFLVLLDQAESPLVELELELREDLGCEEAVSVIGDICDQSRLRYVFEAYSPDIVFHAAAYKHVPMMENHPQEAVKVNVMGVKNVADFAVEYGVEKFVMVSTDKAVNPTNVMGATKRIAEMYTQSLNSYARNPHTRFVTTRFGNVLGSNGSVVPRFKRQIEAGGPITVTHPDITRYFMTIPEACQLVLEAGSMGKGGEIFLFDMGEPVKIVDLAKKMIKLCGLEFKKDIDIKFTGLRAGEKLYEELLNNAENTVPTHHAKIMTALVRQQQYEKISNSTDVLIEMLDSPTDDLKLVGMMKFMVPEYVSNSSKYEVLDKQQAQQQR